MKHLIRIGTAALLAVLLVALLAVPAMASVSPRGISGGDTLYVDTPNTGSLNVREFGNASAKIIKQIPNGTSVIAGDSIDGNYLLITVAGNGANPAVTGWVDMSFLSVNPPKKVTPTPTPAAEDETVKSLNFRSYKFPTNYLYVAAKPSRVGGFVNLRWVPSTDAAVIEKMYAGEELEVIMEGSAWYQVKCADGYVGFIMKQFTQVTYNSPYPRESFGTAADATAN